MKKNERVTTRMMRVMNRWRNGKITWHDVVGEKLTVECIDLCHSGAYSDGGGYIDIYSPQNQSTLQIIM